MEKYKVSNYSESSVSTKQRNKTRNSIKYYKEVISLNPDSG